MAYITELLGFIGLDVDDESFKKAEGEISDVATVLGGLITIATAAATAVTGAAFAMVNEYANTATEIDQVTKRLNVNAEAFQATAYAAKSFGIEQDQLADGMKELSMRAGELALTGEGSFKDVASQLGLTREQVKSYGNDVNGLFNLVRDKLAAIQNQGKRQFLADALFGGGLADVGGEFFSQTSDNISALQKQAMDSGLVISDENIKMAREYTREMDYLQARIKGLWNIVAGNLLPIFTRITKAIKEFLDLHGDTIVNGLTTAIKGLVEALKYLGIAAAIALPYLIGSAAIAGWAKLVALISATTEAFALLRVTALLAWAAAAVGPALLGLAIAALIIAIQDVYGYFNGEDSLTGRIIKAFKDMDLSVRKIWDDMVDYIISAVDRLDKALYDAMPEWVQDTLKSLSGGSYNPDRSSKTQSNLQSDIPGHEIIPGYTQIIRGQNLQPDIPGQSVIMPPEQHARSVIMPPTQTASPARNAVAGASVTTNDVNITGQINVQANDPQQFADAMRSVARQENMRNNASTVKNLNAGVKY